MEEKFEKIWELALPYRNKRDDEGHARILTDYAIRLCELVGIDKDIVVPAVIMHDIGWSQLGCHSKLLLRNKVSA